MFGTGLYYICSPLSAPTREGIRKNMLEARNYWRKSAGNLAAGPWRPMRISRNFLTIPSGGNVSLDLPLARCS